MSDANPTSSQPAAFGQASQTLVQAAVVRIPVIVPQTIDAVADVHARNAQAMVDAIESAMKGPGPRTRLVVFPVLQLISGRRSLSGLPMSAAAIDITAAPLDQGIFAPVVAACRRHDCYVATSTQEKTNRLPGRYFHTGLIMGPEGLVLRSPKSQAKSAPEVSYLRDLPDDYIKAFGPGSILPVVKTPIGVLGCYIEAEAEVLEAARLMAAKGAQIIVHPTVHPYIAEDADIPWLALKQSIAYQCQVYLLTAASSRYIDSHAPNEGWCGGASTIVGPDGKLIASIEGHEEGFVSGVIDLAAVARAKARNADKTTPAWKLYDKLYATGAGVAR